MVTSAGGPMGVSGAAVMMTTGTAAAVETTRPPIGVGEGKGTRDDGAVTHPARTVATGVSSCGG